jgi:hypothetical protein
MSRKLLMAAVLFVTAMVSSSANAAKQGEMCAGFTGVPCDAGLWCQIRTGLCQAADGPGSCVKVPEVCSQIFQPVCGCNGKTYGNDCERQAAKVSKAHDGACS